MATTSSKAVGGGVGANLTVIAVWLVTTIPGWENIPIEPKAAIIGLVAWCVGYGCVWVAKANVEHQSKATAPLGRIISHSEAQ